MLEHIENNFHYLFFSYGITVHKSQRLSLQNAVMDMGNSVFINGQVYVALSQVTSLDGLHLINFDPSSVSASEEATILQNIIDLNKCINQNQKLLFQKCVIIKLKMFCGHCQK